MNNWVAVVLLLVIVLAAGLLRERWRVSRIEGWARASGFTRRFPVPPEGPQPAAVMVSRLSVHGARIWGLLLDGTIDGAAVTIAEHESSEPAKKTGVWHTIVTWPIADAGGSIFMQRGTGSRAVARAAEAIIGAVKRPMADALGLSIGDAASTVETPGGWVVGGDPIVRDRWLTPEKMRELDAWAHGGEFVREDGFGAWRLRELTSVDALTRLIEQLPAARRLLQ